MTNPEDSCAGSDGGEVAMAGEVGVKEPGFGFSWLVYLLCLFLGAIFLLTGCTRLKIPIMEYGDGKMAYATYTYAFYDKEGEFIKRPDGTIEFRKKDTSRGQDAMDAVILAAAKVVLAGAAGGK